MQIESLISLFSRDLKKLKQELQLYSYEEDLWIIDKDIKNTAGNLAWHLIGNLNNFIGAHLGDTGYVRDRPGEFNDKNIPREKLLHEIDKTIPLIESVLPKYQERLNETYPLEVFGKPMTIGFFLVHLHSHLNYHRGQINYHRRLLAR